MKTPNRAMLSPMLAMARHHLGGFVAVAFAVFGGSAMITAGLVVGETGLTSHLPVHRLAGADVLVSAPQSYPVVEDIDIALPERATVPPDLVDDVAAVPGVAAAANDLTFTVSLPDSIGQVDGHGWDVRALDDPTVEGTSPHGSGEVALDAGTADAAGLGVGDRVRIDASGGDRSYLLTGVIDGPGHGAWFEQQTATDLADRADGRVDLVAVTVEPGADVEAVAEQIEATLGGSFLATTGDARGDVETIAGGTARGELIALAGSLAGTLLILVGCIVASALSVSVANQRRDLALLRAVGATPREVRRIIATQATVVALAALVPGIVVGHVLAGLLAGALTDAGMMPAELALARSPFAALVVTALVLVTVQVAARGASWRASRMPATEAVAESRVEPREPSRVRALVGVALIGTASLPSLVPLFVRSEAALISSASGALLAIVGLMLAGPALVRAVTGRAARRLRDRTPAPTWLAVNNSHSYALRTADAVLVLALAIGLTLTQYYVQSTLDRAVETEHGAGLVADATVTGGVSAADVSGLAAEPGVVAAVPVAVTTVLHTHDLLGEPTTEAHPTFAFGPGAEAVVDLDVVEGTLADLDGETIALSSPTARSWGVGIGDPVEVVLANGAEVRPRVVAVYERGFGFGSTVVSTELLAGFGGDRWSDTVLVAGDLDAVDAWAAERPGTAVESGSPLAGDAGSSPENWISMLVLLAMLGYVLVALANSLVASTLRRRSEFAALRLIGATPRQIRAMVTRETAVLSTLAVGAGLLVAVLPMSLLGLGIMGRPWPQGPVWVAAVISATVVLIAWAATRAAAGRALRLS